MRPPAGGGYILSSPGFSCPREGGLGLCDSRRCSDRDQKAKHDDNCSDGDGGFRRGADIVCARSWVRVARAGGRPLGCWGQGSARQRRTYSKDYDIAVKGDEVDDDAEAVEDVAAVDEAEEPTAKGAIRALGAGASSLSFVGLLQLALLSPKVPRQLQALESRVRLGVLGHELGAVFGKSGRMMGLDVWDLFSRRGSITTC